MFIINTEAAIYKDNHYLICKRSEKEEHAPGGIALIGGKVELEGASSNILERTIIREVEEEVGLIIEGRPRYVHSTSFVTDHGEPVVNVIFLCEEFSGEPYAVSADEVADLYWMTPEEVYKHPDAKEYLKDYIRMAEDVRVKGIPV
ncbi:NUDIX domain-containing protein [Sporosarcina thermotolerans]|uniref:NUDIX domain-containing protein n=1 Tax=Sporosarcina thermotolerans TaxID=633404 RepID=A0AAW9A9S4_9BACL|nr:NUDIX domain-containing protein [Sporosarcina thermotolerans]MDW0116665.1 NUDIX domain-containing protein [Sporosarcina thermotolerans]WHT48861.1 NUDIX domain-containing protein [Sporosarcina thermotolerans]